MTDRAIEKVQDLMSQVEDALALVAVAMAGTPFEETAGANTEKLMAKAQAQVDARDREGLEETAEVLSRTLSMFRGMSAAA